MARNKHSGWGFVVLTILSFASLMLELVVMLLQPEGLKLNFSNWELRQIVLHWVYTCIVWGLAVFLMYMYSKKKLNFDVFDYRDKPSAKALLWALGLLVIATLGMTMEWGQFKPIAEFHSLSLLYGKMGIIAFIFQYVYYLFEAMLIVLTIVFGQKAGELLFRKTNIPWGGLASGVFWGLPHLFTKNLLTGVLGFLVSILYGVAYLLVKKNVRFAYPLIFLMFVL